MTIPTRDKMRADLACAMGWKVIRTSRGFMPISPEGYAQLNYKTEDFAWATMPDPFTNAADNRALVEWLAEQSPVAWGNFTGCLIDAAIPFHVQPYADWEMVCRAVLTAPIETIAEAAWRAIQEAKCE